MSHVPQVPAERRRAHGGKLLIVDRQVHRRTEGNAFGKGACDCGVPVVSECHAARFFARTLHGQSMCFHWLSEAGWTLAAVDRNDRVVQSWLY